MPVLAQLTLIASATQMTVTAIMTPPTALPGRGRANWVELSRIVHELPSARRWGNCARSSRTSTSKEVADGELERTDVFVRQRLEGETPLEAERTERRE